MKLDQVLEWYSGLVPARIAELDDLYHEDARFRDPFNDVRGHESIAGIFLHMFDTTGDPVFVIGDTHSVGETAWVSWAFEFTLAGRRLHVDGVSRLDFGNDGRVMEHRDYWDATELFAQLPLLGGITAYLKRRFQASPRGGI